MRGIQPSWNSFNAVLPGTLPESFASCTTPFFALPEFRIFYSHVRSNSCCIFSEAFHVALIFPQHQAKLRSLGHTVIKVSKSSSSLSKSWVKYRETWSQMFCTILIYSWCGKMSVFCLKLHLKNVSPEILSERSSVTLFKQTYHEGDLSVVFDLITWHS